MFIDDREKPEKPERRSWVWKEKNKKTCMMCSDERHERQNADLGEHAVNLGEHACTEPMDDPWSWDFFDLTHGNS